MVPGESLGGQLLASELARACELLARRLAVDRGCATRRLNHHVVPALWTPTPMKSGGPTVQPAGMRRGLPAGAWRAGVGRGCSMVSIVHLRWARRARPWMGRVAAPGRSRPSPARHLTTVRRDGAACLGARRRPRPGAGVQVVEDRDREDRAEDDRSSRSPLTPPTPSRARAGARRCPGRRARPCHAHRFRRQMPRLGQDDRRARTRASTSSDDRWHSAADLRWASRPTAPVSRAAARIASPPDEQDETRRSADVRRDERAPRCDPHDARLHRGRAALDPERDAPRPGAGG